MESNHIKTITYFKYTPSDTFLRIRWGYYYRLPFSLVRYDGDLQYITHSLSGLGLQQPRCLNHPMYNINQLANLHFWRLKFGFTFGVRCKQPLMVSNIYLFPVSSSDISYPCHPCYPLTTMFISWTRFCNFIR